jgi:penicillin-binding protein 1C
MSVLKNRTSNLTRHPSSATWRTFVTFALALCCVALAFLLRPIGARDLPQDARALTFVDRNGAFLGTVLGRDGRHTIAVPLGRIAPAFLDALRATEDHRFAEHGVLDPLATLRAFEDAALARRLPSGASTLGIQLARQLVPVGDGPFGKLIEVIVAQRLENGLSKAQILEAYANRAPMGSNLYGVEAASRTYFGVAAAHLDLAQAAFLAGLPNDPVRLDPYFHPGAALARRRFVLARMHADGFIDRAQETRAAAEHLSFQPRSAGIVAGAHFLFFLAPRIAPGQARVRTTLDRELQRFVERQTSDVVARLAQSDVADAAAIVIDNATGDVLAYAGSPDYFDERRLGRNDGVQALRQPGSTLKPFLYELALETRTARPTTILADVPTTYALPRARLYEPADYSRRFAGPVRLRIALADSLNVPAVRVLSTVGVPNFLARLRALGFAHLTQSPDYYGLGLTLGGGEVSLYELARAYSTLARGGAPANLRTTLDATNGTTDLQAVARDDPAWAFVTDVLADPYARSAAFGTHSILELPFPAAVKTGTSSDFRDTWTAGFTRDYTVAVWAGNFDGRPMRGISGVTGAAPLWNRIMLHLYADRDAAAFTPPAGYERRSICATTGTAPSTRCPAVVEEWLDPGDRAYLARARAPSVPAVAYDEWLISQPERSRVPTRILYPRDGDRFVANPSARIQVEVAGATPVRLTLDGRLVAPESGAFVVPVGVGVHRLVARSRSGTSTASFVGGAGIARTRSGFTIRSPALHVAARGNP